MSLNTQIDVLQKILHNIVLKTAMPWCKQTCKHVHCNSLFGSQIGVAYGKVHTEGRYIETHRSGCHVFFCDVKSPMYNIIRSSYKTFEMYDQGSD